MTKYIHTYFVCDLCGETIQEYTGKADSEADHVNQFIPRHVNRVGAYDLCNEHFAPVARIIENIQEREKEEQENQNMNIEMNIINNNRGKKKPTGKI